MMDVNERRRLRHLLKDTFSRTIQWHHTSRDLNVWEYLTSRTMLARGFYGAKIALHEARRHILLNKHEFEFHLGHGPEQGQDHSHGLLHANRERLAQLRLHMQATSLCDIVRRAVKVSRSYKSWAKAKARADFTLVQDDFESLLRHTRALAVRKARLLRLDKPYDALVDEQTPGLRSRDIDVLVDELEPFCKQALSAARLQAAADQGVIHYPAEVWRMDLPMQKRITYRLLQAIGFDCARGRLGEGLHPICVGSRDDVRIALNYDPEDFVKSVLDALHEGGHGLYRQNLPDQWHWHPVGSIPSQGMDEAMALIIEVCIGRSRAFADFLYELIIEETGTAPRFSRDGLYRRLTALENTPIRAYADEIRYPLDLILRYRIGQDLVSGRLAVADLPARWNADMKALTGMDTANDAEGCLQDIHWYTGQIGYFTNYLVGIVMANQLFDTMRAEIPDLSASIRKGDFMPVYGWLNDRIYRHGARYSTFDLLARACGAPPGVGAYMDNISHRYFDGQRPDLAASKMPEQISTADQKPPRRWRPQWFSLFN